MKTFILTLVASVLTGSVWAQVQITLPPIVQPTQTERDTIQTLQVPITTPTIIRGAGGGILQMQPEESALDGGASSGGGIIVKTKIGEYQFLDMVDESDFQNLVETRSDITEKVKALDYEQLKIRTSWGSNELSCAEEKISHYQQIDPVRGEAMKRALYLLFVDSTLIQIFDKSMQNSIEYSPRIDVHFQTAIGHYQSFYLGGTEGKLIISPLANRLNEEHLCAFLLHEMLRNLPNLHEQYNSVYQESSSSIPTFVLEKVTKALMRARNLELVKDILQKF